MNADDKKLIEEATASLKLLDISLIGSHFSRPEDFPLSGNAQYSKLEKRVYTQIEADFIAFYLVESTLTDAHFQAFSEFNSLHNVWPFWRQHVFDIVQRGRLPTIDIPLMAGKKLNVERT